MQFFSTMLLCNFYSLESLFTIYNVTSQYNKLSTCTRFIFKKNKLRKSFKFLTKIMG